MQRQLLKWACKKSCHTETEAAGCFWAFHTCRIPTELGWLSVPPPLLSDFTGTFLLGIQTNLQVRLTLSEDVPSGVSAMCRLFTTINKPHPGWKGDMKDNLSLTHNFSEWIWRTFSAAAAAKCLAAFLLGPWPGRKHNNNNNNTDHYLTDISKRWLTPPSFPNFQWYYQPESVYTTTTHLCS